MFEFPLDACVVTRVGQYTYMVQPEDGLSPVQILELVVAGGQYECYLDGVLFGTDGFLGIWDLSDMCPVVGASYEYDSIRFEFAV